MPRPRVEKPPKKQGGQSERPMTQTAVDDDVVAELRQQIFGDDITADQLAAVLGLDRTTVLRYLRDGDIIGYQMGRTWYAPKSSIAAYRQQRLEQQQHHAAQQKTIGSGVVLAASTNVWFSDGEWHSEIKDVLSLQGDAPLLIDLMTVSLDRNNLPEGWDCRALISVEHGDKEFELPLDELLGVLTFLKAKWEE